MKRAQSRASYISRVLAAAKRAQEHGRLEKGGTYVVDVFHDEGCPALARTGACACEVEVGEVERVKAPEVV